jgi:hypothetical protein
MEKHVFMLVTGVECEIIPLTGNHSDIFYNPNYIKRSSNLGRLLAAMIVRIGSVTDIRYNVSEKEQERLATEGVSFFDVNNLLSADASKIIAEARKFNYETSKFTFQHVHNGYFVDDSTESGYKPVKMTKSWVVDIDNIDIKPYHTITYDEQGEEIYEIISCKEYHEVIAKTSNIEYRCGTKKIFICVPNLRSQTALAVSMQNTTGTQHKAMSHIALRMLSYTFKNEDGKTFEPRELPIKHYNKLVELITKNFVEGDFDLTAKLSNPWHVPDMPIDYEKGLNLPENTVALLAQEGFLFVSGV